ncbi:lactate utilization protein C [Vagococcus penaei]|uniref:Lactate utilization protein C n=1 Tax=Vagococcus penaei TaxID=633807 RepID=A0A1Q2D858_9ENTE|nr:lactate utilization protein C [Vagococcus penaei]AQP54501.1 lactate utilization protein C [Vagococcus penaei]RSU06790.1 lactate utilization protein C [Vagococcus penaei]
MTEERIYQRDSFLKNLHAKLGTTPQSVTAHPFKPLNELPETTLADKTPDELMIVCQDRASQIGVELFETTTKNVSHLLKDIIEECHGGPLMLPSSPNFENPMFDLFKETYSDSIHYWKQGEVYREENIATAQAANVSIAFAEFLLAESCSVVVETSAEQGRTLHFLPNYYISLIPKSRLVPRSTQAAKYYDEKIKANEKIGSAIHFISGPSNSGDIEMQLVTGLHGPVKVFYIVLEDI